MDMTKLQDKIETEHAANPQRKMMARHFLQTLQEAIAGLLSLGHRVEMHEAPPLPPQEFPKMLWSEGREKVVENQQEEEYARKSGWGDMPGGEPPEVSEAPHPAPPRAPPPVARVTIPASIAEAKKAMGMPEEAGGKDGR